MSSRFCLRMFYTFIISDQLGASAESRALISVALFQLEPRKSARRREVQRPASVETRNAHRLQPSFLPPSLFPAQSFVPIPLQHGLLNFNPFARLYLFPLAHQPSALPPLLPQLLPSSGSRPHPPRFRSSRLCGGRSRQRYRRRSRQGRLSRPAGRRGGARSVSFASPSALPRLSSPPPAP